MELFVEKNAQLQEFSYNLAHMNKIVCGFLPIHGGVQTKYYESLAL